MSLEFKHILVPVDFEEPSKQALDTAIELAKRHSAQLTIVHVFEIYKIPCYSGLTPGNAILQTQIAQAAREDLQRLLAKARLQIQGAKAILCAGTCIAEILRVITEEHADLVVIGTHGRQGLERRS